MHQVLEVLDGRLINSLFIQYGDTVIQFKSCHRTITGHHDLIRQALLTSTLHTSEYNYGKYRGRESEF
jgi:hypothetical protein